MATGRIGVTPTLGTRWSKAPAGGTTSLSGLDDNSVSLVYSVGYEQVYRNGVLLSRGNDYTATTGNSITLIDATIAGDIIEVFANELVPLTDAISKGQFTAKGALLSATAASTPAVLTVGSNNQVLTADSTTSTGLKWATVASSGANWSLLNTGGTALTGAQTITVSGISNAEQIMVLIQGASSASASSYIQIRINGDTSSNYYNYGPYLTALSTYGSGVFDAQTGADASILMGRLSTNESSNLFGYVLLNGCNSSGRKIYTFAGAARGQGVTGAEAQIGGGYYDSSSTISSITIRSNVGNFDAGTIFVYTSAN